jgi:hypothetical protein
MVQKLKIKKPTWLVMKKKEEVTIWKVFEKSFIETKFFWLST